MNSKYINMKTTSIVILLILFAQLGISQDVIHKESGEQISANVIEITPESVKYKSPTNPNGPIIGLSIESLSHVIFENGERHDLRPEFYLGKEYGGGYIFHVNKDGKHGLIAAPEDIPGKTKWGRAQKRIGAEHADDGAVNTSLINSEFGIKSAAGKCAAYSNDGFDDWYLPSINELDLLYQNREHVPGLGHNQDAPRNNDYCSSTEFKNRNDCLAIHFGRNGKHYYYNKRDVYRVRAVRKF
jgi:hypothetical protein